MAEQVHPRDSTGSNTSGGSGQPSGTYVIQVPKDQIYRHPPPENALRQKKFSRGKPRHSCCCRCLCWTISLLLILVVLLAATAGILYLIFRPEAPKYTVDRVSIKGFNMTSLSPISPEFDITVRADNPNNKIGIYYEKDSSVAFRYNDIKLSDGVLPVFYQPSNNITVFVTQLRGSDVILSSSMHSELISELKEGNVPFKLNMKAPVKIKVGAIKTWTITVKVKCDIIVDSLTTSSNIVSKHCDYSVKLW